MCSRAHAAPERACTTTISNWECVNDGRWPMTREPAFAVATHAPSAALGGSAQISDGGPFANGLSYGRSMVGATATWPIRAGDETRYDAFGVAGACPTTNAATPQHALRQLHDGAASCDEWDEDACSWPACPGIGISAEPWWCTAVATFE